MPVKRYEVLQDSAICPEAKRGTVIYDFHGHDYGCSNDDARATGIEHAAFTLDPEGGGPFFTHPVTGVRLLTD